MDSSNAVVRPQKSKFRLVWLAYQQIAAVLGAFGLAAFFGHFVQFDWHGALTSLFGIWNAIVRPTVELFLNVTVIALAKRVGWNLNIPLIWRDYLSAGAVMFLSLLRVQAVNRDPALKSGIGFWIPEFLISIILIPFWPVFFIGAALMPFGVFAKSQEKRESDFRDGLMMLSPFGYLLIAIAVNQAL